jgi:hypothetical protein
VLGLIGLFMNIEFCYFENFERLEVEVEIVIVVVVEMLIEVE